VPVPCFLLFLCFRKVTQEIFSELTKPKPDVQIFHGASRTPKRRRSRTRGWPHHRAAWPRAGPCPLVVWAPWSTSDAAPSPIKTPRRENPKDPITFAEHIAIRRAIDPKIGRVQKLFLAPCRRGESPPEVFFIDMLASGMMSE
jgi:hypothetical protein